MNNFDKEKLPVLILIIEKSKSKTKNIYIGIISVDIYHTTCYLKKIQVFAMSMKDI